MIPLLDIRGRSDGAFVVKELSGHPRQRRYKWIAVDVFGMTPPPSEPAGDDSVSFSVTIENGETVITMRGDRDTAVIVRSDAGERIYLPPEDFDRDARANAAGSGVTPADSPYDGRNRQPLPVGSDGQSIPVGSDRQPVSNRRNGRSGSGAQGRQPVSDRRKRQSVPRRR